jgi:signal peptidase I
MSDTAKFVLNATAVVVIALVLVRLLFIELVVVADNGMAPTLVYGDEVLVWTPAKVDMADVVLCEHPAKSGELVIGRAVVFAGHTVRSDHNGMLYVDNDQAATQVEGRVRFYDVTRKKQWDMQLGQIDYFGKHSHPTFVQHGDRLQLPTYRVEKGVYLLGDNRSERSFDSREFGEVNPERCIGQIFMRWKPAPPTGDDLGHGRLDVIP